MIPVSDLTQTSLDGQGVFDTLMRATKTHLEYEFQQGRIKGTEYSTVYLGSLEVTMRTALEFLLQRQKVALEAQLMEQQVLVAQAEVAKANAMVQVALAEVDKTRLEVEILQLSKDKIPAEIAVLLATKCKLDAEFDLIVGQTAKTGTESSLLNQKITTERAQVSAVGVDGDSVIGKQKALYNAQAEGFQRDAEQKAATILVDTWKVRRSTDEDEQANDVNNLHNPTIARAINKLMAGIGA